MVNLIARKVLIPFPFHVKFSLSPQGKGELAADDEPASPPSASKSPETPGTPPFESTSSSPGLATSPWGSVCVPREREFFIDDLLVQIHLII